MSRLLRFLAGSELGLLSSFVFGALYVWPLLTFQKPSSTLSFMFCVWCLHIALIGATNYASRRVAAPRSYDESPGSPTA
jgi:hypothetical protein